jgi:SAM-dependent methyltransferase
MKQKQQIAANCPVCGSLHHYVLWTKTSAELVEMWRQHLGMDIRSELGGMANLELRECGTCEVQFFSPCVTGGESLYHALQKNDWYYMDDKWEHRKAFAEIAQGQRVCEVGCGQGAFVERVNRAGRGDAVGLELNSEAVAMAKVCHVPVECVLLEEYAMGNPKVFDFVCSFQVLEHVSDPLGFVKLSAKLLKPGGKLVLSVPNRDAFTKWFENVLDMPPHHVTRWSVSAITKLLATCGFNGIHVHYEPLAIYHVDDYVRSWTLRTQDGVFGKLFRHWRVKRFLTRMLSYNFLRRMIRGHTFYVSARLLQRKTS